MLVYGFGYLLSQSDCLVPHTSLEQQLDPEGIGLMDSEEDVHGYYYGGPDAVCWA